MTCLPPAWRAVQYATAAAALVSLLAGCVETTTAPWGRYLGDYQAAPRDLIGVQSYAATHFVRVGPGGTIGRAERAALDRFIVEVAKNRPESLRVALYGRAAPVGLAAVRHLLIANGVNPWYISEAKPLRQSYYDVPGGTVAVAVERAIAVAPACPGFTGHPAAPNDNLSDPNLGCANVYNFAAMIDDPHELYRGASSIYSLAEPGALAVDAWRQDKMKSLPPLNEETFAVVR